MKDDNTFEGSLKKNKTLEKEDWNPVENVFLGLLDKHGFFVSPSKIDPKFIEKLHFHRVRFIALKIEKTNEYLLILKKRLL